MIKPVNGHLLIEPLPQESFIASGRETYQEIGVVIDYDEMIDPEEYGHVWTGTALEKPPKLINKGDKVYFDSWLAAKFPKDKESHYWLVKWEDVRAVEYAEVPE
jgi:co-chaperonin GroES (HSP10)